MEDAGTASNTSRCFLPTSHLPCASSWLTPPQKSAVKGAWGGCRPRGQSLGTKSGVGESDSGDLSPQRPGHPREEGWGCAEKDLVGVWGCTGHRLGVSLLSFLPTPNRRDRQQACLLPQVLTVAAPMGSCRLFRGVVLDRCFPRAGGTRQRHTGRAQGWDGPPCLPWGAS